MQKIKLALLGTGKTGGEVLKLLKKRRDVDLEVFNSKNKLTKKVLKNFYAIVVFLPGDVFLNYLPILRGSGICVISGCTGFIYPENFNEECEENKQIWVQANNFSLAMIFIKKALNALGELQKIAPDYQYALEETHHLSKKDKPSGTALNWKKWLGENFIETQITSFRKDDIIGEHRLSLTSPFECIKLEHVAKDRGLFAKGAVWVLDAIMADKKLPKKFYQFEEIVHYVLETVPGK